MEAKEKALRLCQDIAMTTFGQEFNEGTTLPLAITKKIAFIMVDEIIPCTWKESTYKRQGITWVEPLTTTEYWQEVKKCIEAL